MQKAISNYQKPFINDFKDFQMFFKNSTLQMTLISFVVSSQSLNIKHRIELNTQKISLLKFPYSMIITLGTQLHQGALNLIKFSEIFLIKLVIILHENLLRVFLKWEIAAIFYFHRNAKVLYNCLLMF